MTLPASIATSRPPVRILHLIVELSIGGAQSALLRLLKHLDRQRFEPQVACYYNGDGVVARQIRANGIPVIDLGMSGKYRIDAFWRFYRLLRTQRPTILHTWMFHANISGRLIGKLAGVPLIISSERTMGQEGIFRRWVDRSTVGLTNSVVCVSQSVSRFAQDTIGLPVSKLTVIPNGIDLDQYDQLLSQGEARGKFNLPKEALIVGAIGRPRPVKGYLYLVEAFARLADTYPAACLVFIGNGPDRPNLIDKVRSLGLEDRVIFLDDQTDIPGLLPAIDILAVPSLYEGMPNVVIEAMAAGVPVVATNVGGTQEVIINGETGILVPPQDANALSEGISSLLQKPDLRRQIGLSGQQRAYKFYNIQNTVQQTQLLYDKLYQDEYQR